MKSKIVLPLILAVLSSILVAKHVPGGHHEYSLAGGAADAFGLLFKSAAKMTDDVFRTALKSANVGGDTLGAIMRGRKAYKNGTPIKNLDDAANLTSDQVKALKSLKPKEILRIQRIVEAEAQGLKGTTATRKQIKTLLDDVTNMTSDQTLKATKAINESLMKGKPLKETLNARQITDTKLVKEIEDSVQTNLNKISNEGVKFRFKAILQPELLAEMKRAKMVDKNMTPTKAANMTDHEWNMAFAKMDLNQMKATLKELKNIKNPTAAQLERIKAIEDLIGSKPYWKRPSSILNAVSIVAGLGVGLYFLITDMINYFDDNDDADGPGRDLEGECADDYGLQCTLWNIKNWLSDPTIRLFVGGASSLCCCCCCCMIILVLVISMEENSSANSYL